MEHQGFPSNIIRQYQKLLTDTEIYVGGKIIKSHRSTIQGSNSGAILWCLYINDLIEELNVATAEKTEINENGQRDYRRYNGKIVGHCYCFADDILCACRTQKQLDDVITIIKRWSERNKVKINLQKSAVLICRRDRRTHASL